MLGVEVQREGAVDPQQQGHAAPVILPKKELGRFLQRIADAQKRERVQAEAIRAREAESAARAAAREAAAADDASAASAAARQATVLPAGTRRSAFKAGLSYVQDPVSNGV